MQLQDPKAHTDTLSLIADYCQAGTLSKKKSQGLVRFLYEITAELTFESVFFFIADICHRNSAISMTRAGEGRGEKGRTEEEEEAVVEEEERKAQFHNRHLCSGFISYIYYGR
jgi:hypothetical protein